jgi:hypothetical protein
MLTWILGLVATVVAWIPTNVWVFIILAGCVIFGLCGEGWTFPIRATIFLIMTYYFLSFVAYLLPGWLETIIVLFIIGAGIHAII